MTVIHRTQREKETIEGRKPIINWRDDDNAVADGDIKLGRIYRHHVPAGVRWLWFLNIVGAAPNSGSADTLDEAKAAIEAAYAGNTSHRVRFDRQPFERIPASLPMSPGGKSVRKSR